MRQALNAEQIKAQLATGHAKFSTQLYTCVDVFKVEAGRVEWEAINDGRHIGWNNTPIADFVKSMIEQGARMHWTIGA